MKALIIAVALPLLLTLIVTDVIVNEPGSRARKKRERAERFTRSHWNKN